MHNRYNDTFRQFNGVQIGDWCPLLGTDAMLFQERMLWILDGAGAAGVVPHDLLWMLAGYQPLVAAQHGRHRNGHAAAARR